MLRLPVYFCCFFLFPILSFALSRNTWFTQPHLRAAFSAPASGRGNAIRAREGNVTALQVAQEGNVTIRYKKVTLCETTEGVNTYAGYVDLDAHSHVFFWFFEARKEPEKKPVTLWLNGGPGSDSMIGLFNEMGPCTVNPDLTTQLNQYSWSEASNLLFLSQPLGVGYSYTDGPNEGTSGSPSDKATEINTSRLAAAAAWHVVQTFVANLSQMGARVQSREFNLWTESYGGHYGPAFLRYFQQHNELIRIGEADGVPLELKTLGIGNGIIDAVTQFPYYPKFAANNTYQIKALQDDMVTYMTMACHMKNGCVEQAQLCGSAIHDDRTNIRAIAICTQAANMCRDNVEGPFYAYGNVSMYDIRRPSTEPPYQDFFIRYLNRPETQEALGVEVDFAYEETSVDVYSAFQQSGDYVYPDFKTDLEVLLDTGIRVVLAYGDADYIGNWFGGEALSLKLNYSQSFFFAQAPYTPLTHNLIQHGQVREYGHLTFVRVSDAGHLYPKDKPEVALEIFRRAIMGLDVASGTHAMGESPVTIPVPLEPDAPIPDAPAEPSATPSPTPAMMPLRRWTRPI